MKKEFSLQQRLVVMALVGALPLAAVALCLIHLSVSRSIEGLSRARASRMLCTDFRRRWPAKRFSSRTQ